MGYDLHITRKSSWHDDDGPAISRSEWEWVVAQDPELTLDIESQHEGWTFAYWKDEMHSLAHADGEIRAKNPSDNLIRKMIQIAERLGARVQGDDGELYPDAFAENASSRQHYTATRWIIAVAAVPVFGLACAISVGLAMRWDEQLQHEARYSAHTDGLSLSVSLAWHLAGILCIGLLLAVFELFFGRRLAKAQQRTL